MLLLLSCEQRRISLGTRHIERGTRRKMSLSKITQQPIRIAVIGDFEPTYHSHFATNAALYDAASSLSVPLKLRWIPTSSLGGPDADAILSPWDGLIASPGSPYKSFTGMLRGIEFARTRDWPFAGT